MIILVFLHPHSIPSHLHYRVTLAVSLSSVCLSRRISIQLSADIMIIFTHSYLSIHNSFLYIHSFIHIHFYSLMLSFILVYNQLYISHVFILILSYTYSYSHIHQSYLHIHALTRSSIPTQSFIFCYSSIHIYTRIFSNLLKFTYSYSPSHTHVFIFTSSYSSIILLIHSHLLSNLLL